MTSDHEHSALAHTELPNRAPEEWELYRPIACRHISLNPVYRAVDGLVVGQLFCRACGEEYFHRDPNLEAMLAHYQPPLGAVEGRVLAVDPLMVGETIRTTHQR